jgi:Phosphate transporter family
VLNLHAAPPPWVIAVCGLAIAAAKATGGWRIIQTLGPRITEIESPQGFAVETASTAVILSAAHLGFALSTTQGSPPPPRSTTLRPHGPSPFPSALPRKEGRRS